MATIGGLTWDTQGEHYYYTGIDGVALFVWKSDKDPLDAASNKKGWYGAPVNWDGVTSLNESPSGAESNKLYADNLEYLNLLSKEEFGLTLESYQVPEAFDECDGITVVGAMKARGQARATFGLVYRVQKGSDTTQAGELGYVYHVVYGCKASPSSRDFATVNDSPEAQTFSYEISTTTMSNSDILSRFSGVTGLVHLEIDTSDLSPDQISFLEKILYNGSLTLEYAAALNTALNRTVEYTDTALGRMATPDEIDVACAYVVSNG